MARLHGCLQYHIPRGMFLDQRIYLVGEKKENGNVNIYFDLRQIVVCSDPTLLEASFNKLHHRILHTSFSLTIYIAITLENAAKPPKINSLRS